MRFDRPVGTLLLLWPALWGLWLAGNGWPGIQPFLIIVTGVVIMRAAGCVINDFADRHLDNHVRRTLGRPLPHGDAAPAEALLLFATLCSLALLLLLLTNPVTVRLAVPAAILAIIYPFMKRWTDLPQLVLGAAFSMAIPMAWTCVTGDWPPAWLWLVFCGNLLWTLAYDTMYAMVDRPDDLKAGIRSTAILFGDMDRFMIGLLQVMALASLALAGRQAGLDFFWYLGLAAAAGLMAWQQYLIRHRDTRACFEAFLNNTWTGLVIFAGLMIDFAWR
jgi:4-hydroxybenzoate polyprenyltransferase